MAKKKNAKRRAAKEKTVAAPVQSAGATKKQIAKIRKLLNNKSTVDLGCELIITLADPAIYEELLKDCGVDSESGRLEGGHLFRQNQEWRTRALIRILGTAPDGCSLRCDDLVELDLSSVNREQGVWGTNSQIKAIHDSLLVSIPEELSRFTNLKKLSINNTLIRTLPVELADLSNLECLSVSFDDQFFELAYGSSGSRRAFLKTVPRQIRELKNLRELKFSKNSIRTLPKEIGDLVSLRELDLSGNPLRTLPESFGNLSKLETLDLRYTKLKTLPESVAGLVNLQSLDLSDSSLKTLPESIGSLANLRSLDLTDSDLTELPDGIGGLTSLKTLNLYGTNVQHLPSAIGQLKTLESLRLPDTIKEIPKELGNLNRLLRIDIQEDFWGNELQRSATARIILGLCRQLLELDREHTHES